MKLAVQFSTDKPGSAVTTASSEDDDQEVDEFVSSHGFEFIDGDNDSRARALDSDDDSTGEFFPLRTVHVHPHLPLPVYLGCLSPCHCRGTQTNAWLSWFLATPGLGRIVDALSTIMWPSMIQPSSEPASKRKSRARELLDWAREEESDDGFRALVQPSIDEAEGDTDNPPSSTPSVETKRKTSRMQKEMDEFQRWLEEDESERVNEDPWARRGQLEFGSPSTIDSFSGAKTPTSTTFVGAGVGFAGGDNGFEDDFTDFVGAPMDHEPRKSESDPAKKSSFAYMSLGSEFDIIEGDDTDIPSQDEIQATSRRLFGSPSPHPPTPASVSKQQQPLLATDISDIGASPAPSTTTLGDDDDSEFAQFDLSRVFSALQVMKEEISEMSDDAERRRAAARVALGLVYGLQRDEDVDVQ